MTKFEGTVLKRIEPKQVQTKSAVILWYFWFITRTTVGFGDYAAVDYQPQRFKKLFLNTSINYSSNDISFEAGEPTATKFFKQLLYTLLSIVDLCTVSGVSNSIVAAIDERKCYSQYFGCVPRETQDRIDNQQSNC